MSWDSTLSAWLSEKTPILGLELYVVIGICVALVIVVILCILFVWTTCRRKFRAANNSSIAQIPCVPNNIKDDRVEIQRSIDRPENVIHSVHDRIRDQSSDKIPARFDMSISSYPDSFSRCTSVYHHENTSSIQSGVDVSSVSFWEKSSLNYRQLVSASPLIGLPDFSYLGWGHWFTLRDLDLATNHFSAENILGEGGYGVVYWGKLINGSEIAVKKILNNLGQAEKEFKVEVEAIGHVRHKNLVNLLGYCIEGTQRLLVYEYMNNGNLEQWLHGAMSHQGTLTWKARMEVILDTARALNYLHEGIEPKVVHRDIKSSNILIDDNFNAKVTDFGLAKLLGSDQSHLTTRVMGTLGYVAPEYVKTGLLNEKSDIYSFGVLLLETVTGRNPVDHERPVNEANIVDWIKMMIEARRTEEVADPILEFKPAGLTLKQVLLLALKCVDSDADKRPKMSQVVRILETNEFTFSKGNSNLALLWLNLLSCMFTRGSALMESFFTYELIALCV